MNAAKTTSERVQAMRAARDSLGLRRLEMYAHLDDWPAIKALAEKLQRKRARLAAKNERPCTCHPDDNPPKPCAKRYALSACRAARRPQDDEAFDGDDQDAP